MNEGEGLGGKAGWFSEVLLCLGLFGCSSCLATPAVTVTDTSLTAPEGDCQPERKQEPGPRPSPSQSMPSVPPAHPKEGPVWRQGLGNNCDLSKQADRGQWEIADLSYVEALLRTGQPAFKK